MSATDKRDVLVALFADPHHRPSADSVLNELHQHGWAIVPKALVAGRDELLATVAGLQAALTEARAHIEALHRERGHDESATVAELRQRCERLDTELHEARALLGVVVVLLTPEQQIEFQRTAKAHHAEADALKEGSAPDAD